MDWDKVKRVEPEEPSPIPPWTGRVLRLQQSNLKRQATARRGTTPWRGRHIQVDEAATGELVGCGGAAATARGSYIAAATSLRGSTDGAGEASAALTPSDCGSRRARRTGGCGDSTIRIGSSGVYGRARPLASPSIPRGRRRAGDACRPRCAMRSGPTALPGNAIPSSRESGKSGIRAPAGSSLKSRGYDRLTADESFFDRRGGLLLTGAGSGPSFISHIPTASRRSDRAPRRGAGENRLSGMRKARVWGDTRLARPRRSPLVELLTSLAASHGATTRLAAASYSGHLAAACAGRAWQSRPMQRFCAPLSAMCSYSPPSANRCAHRETWHRSVSVDISR